MSHAPHGGPQTPYFTAGAGYRGGCGSPPLRMPARGCLAQAVSDIVGTRRSLRRTVRIALVPAAVRLVSFVAGRIPVAGAILGLAGLLCAVAAVVCCCGYGIAWGRELLGGSPVDADRSVLRSSLLSLGFFGAALGVLFGAGVTAPAAVVWLAGALSGLVDYSVSMAELDFALIGAALAVFGGVLSVAIFAAVAALGLLLGAVADATAMHLAVTGRLESAFSLREVVRPMRGGFAALLCASAVPRIVAIAAALAVGCALTLLSGALASLPVRLLGGPGPWGPISALGAEGLLSSLATGLFGCFAAFAASASGIVRFRAVGYWAQRHAAGWAHEAESDLEVPLPADAAGCREYAARIARRL